MDKEGGRIGNTFIDYKEKVEKGLFPGTFRSVRGKLIDVVLF
jgi:hypothetical protein